MGKLSTMDADDIARLDAEFADVVLAYLRANRLAAKTDRTGHTRIVPRSPVYKRRHEFPAHNDPLSKAEAKRLRKMARHV